MSTEALAQTFTAFLKLVKSDCSQGSLLSSHLMGPALKSSFCRQGVILGPQLRNEQRLHWTLLYNQILHVSRGSKNDWLQLDLTYRAV